jgi:hypothetical protein
MRPPGWSDEFLEAVEEAGLPMPDVPLPPGYGQGASAPEWWDDSTTGRLAEIARLRAILWRVMQAKARRVFD